MNKLFLTLLLFLAACSRSGCRDSWMESNGRPKVVATTPQVAFVVREIGGERVDVWTLIRGGLDPHSYQLVKGDGEHLDRADLVVANGLGLEHGASLSAWLEGSARVVRVGDSIPPHQLLYQEGRVDPHIWMDASLWDLAIDPVVAALKKLDPPNAEHYTLRAERLHTSIRQLHDDLRRELQQVPSEQRYLVTSHDAFHYFTRAYLADEGEQGWQVRATAPEGLAPEGQISPADLRAVVEYLKAHPVGVIFPETNVSRDAIARIVEAGQQEGVRVTVCEEPLYGDAMEDDYAASMRHNASVMVRHLGGS